MLRLLFLLFLLTSLLCFSLPAQDGHPVLIHYSAKDGLPSSEVYEVLQDQQGYIWISTDNGICRFNGYQFEHFGPEQGLDDPVIFYLFEDHRGWIWMYSFKDQIYIYRDGEISLYEHSDLLASFRSKNTPTGADWIYVDRQGTFYISLTGYGIMEVKPSGECVDITQQVSEGLIRWTCEGLSFFSRKIRVTPVPVEATSSISHPLIPLTIFNDDTTTVLQWIPNRIYTDTKKYYYYLNGFFQQDREQFFMQFPDRVELINTNTGESIQQLKYGEGSITTYLEGNQNDYLYLGHNYGNRGLSIYDNTRHHDDLSIINKPSLKILPGKTITHILEDQQGGIWIGTLEDGLYYINNPALMLGYINYSNISKPRSLAIVNADSIWIRTQNHNIYLLSNKTTLTPLAQQKRVNSGYYIHYDPLRKYLWATNLLTFWDNQQWNFVSKEGIVNSPISTNDYYQSFRIFPSNSYPEKYWFFGTTYFYYADFSKQPWQFSPQFTLDPIQRIFVIHEALDGRIFIGGMEGLYQMDDQENILPIREHPAFSRRIEDIAELADGTIILGTKGGGVLLWKDDSILQISEAQGLTSSYIEKIYVDDQQQIWVGTNTGLNRIRLNTEQGYSVYTFTLADGLPSNEITDITSWGNTLWVATVEGVFNMPINLQLFNGPITPIIEEVWVNGELHKKDSLDQLKWFEDNIRIAVTSLDYPQQGETQYRYRFSQKEEWQITKSRLIEAARLSPGVYNFELQAFGRNQVWSPAVMLRFRLQNPFWAQWWFWAIIVAGLLAGLTMYYRWYINRQAKQQLQEKQLIQLESEITDLRQQAYRAQMNPHFVYNCLTAIQSFMLSNSADQLLASDYLSKFALLTRQALEASRSRAISLADDIKMLENYIQLERFRFGEKFSYSIAIEETLSTHEISIPALLVQPYVENAILHGLTELSYPGHLSIRYQMEGNFLLIIVEDNGIGIYQHQLQKGQSPVAKKHNSVGMDIAKKRILTPQFEQLTGQIDIQEIMRNEKPVGTRISVKIPLD